MYTDLYQAGDSVIITEGVRNCEHKYNQHMLDMIGQEVTIKSVGRNHYTLEGVAWMWTDCCFAPAVPSVTEDVVHSIFSELMGG